MASPPRFRRIARESIPGAPAWVEPLLLILNGALGTIALALSGSLTRRENIRSADKVQFRLTTLAVVANTWPKAVKNELPVKVTHCACTYLAKASGAAITAAWSMTWKPNQRNEIELSFQGLEASTEYVATIAYE